MNFKIFQIPSVYTIWDGLSLKTISRYCPFKHGHKKQPLHYGDYLQLLTIIVPSYTPSIFFLDFHVYNL